MLSFVLRGVWRFPLPILATYALLRHQLLGIDVRLKWTILGEVKSAPIPSYNQQNQPRITAMN
jgi:hypothetical protein